MSGWDAPTGSWDSRQGPDDSGRPDVQGYQPGQPTGGYRTMPGGEGRVRAGRRGLPGYDQAQDDDPATVRYDQAPDHGRPPEYGQAPGYGEAPGYGQPPGYGEPPGYGQVPGYGEPPGYGQAPGYRQGYGQHAAGPASLLPGTEQDYQAETYPQPGSEPADYPPGGPGHGGFPPENPPGFGQDAYGRHAYGPGAVTQDGYGPQDYGFPPGYPQDGYAQDGYAQDGYAQDGYAQDGYAQQGFEHPGGSDYDDDGFGPAGRAARAQPDARSPQRLGGTRMFLYLAAAVIGVVVIVLVVVNLTKTGTGNAASGSSTPSTGAGATTAGAGMAPGYVIKLAGHAATYPLNPQAVAAAESVIKSQSAALADRLRSGGAGRATKTVIGIYDLSQVTSIASSAYRGIVFVGYNGTFNPENAITVVRAHLVASRVVKAGPHGGNMVCGYNTSTGADASECVWVTNTTLGVVQFLSGSSPVKNPGASKLALKVRDAVEVPAQ